MTPISVIVTTFNEENNLSRCLKALKNFSEVIVVDSYSQDHTIKIAQDHGAQVESFKWNQKYPKKRQWCLDNVTVKNDFVFFVDGDEELTPELIDEIQSLDLLAPGYFVKGQYIWRKQPLNHGLVNNKLVLFNRHKVEFPIINDLDIEGMGEMEGHYQPVLKTSFQHEGLKQLRAPLKHFAYEDQNVWDRRHHRYARWEAVMIKRKAYPKDPKRGRDLFKSLFRNLPLRPLIAFCHCYFIKRGFLDGIAGFEFAKSRYDYYRMVSRALNANKYAGNSAEEHKPRFVAEK